MDRRYYRKFENYDTVVPRPEDFPVLNAQNEISNCGTDNRVSEISQGLKTDDIVLLVILVLLLMEEEKDMTAIFSVAALLLSGYIF